MKRMALVAAVGAIVLAAAWQLWRHQTTDSNSERQNLSAVPVQRGDLSLPVRASGAIAWERQIAVRPVMPGRLDELRASEGQIVQEGDAVAVMSSLQRALLLDAERASGRDPAKWEEAYQPTTILAPAAGVVANLPLTPGSMLTPETILMTIADSPLIRVFVEESDVPWITSGSIATIDIDALPGVLMTGIVARISTQSVYHRNAVCYEVELDAGRLPASARVGMSVNAEFHGEQRRGVLLVPQSAVVQQNGRTIVRRPGPDGRHEDLEVRVGLTDGLRIEVVDGLQDGDLVLTDAAALQSTARDAARGSPLLPFTRRQ